jgi:leader peptidase (prepilin peptidase)/N-methyltransferase
MGFGDVKLALLLGLVVGWLGWVSNDAVLGPIRLVIYAMLAGLLAGVLFGVLLPMIRRGRAFPLGPGLAIGAVLVVLRASELRI